MQSIPERGKGKWKGPDMEMITEYLFAISWASAQTL